MRAIWTEYHGDYTGVPKRRYAEWYLYTYGIYIPPYENASSGYEDKEYGFPSETPWEDFLNGRL